MEALFQCGQAATELWTTDSLCEMMKQGWCGRCFSWPEFPFGCPTHPCACARNCTHTTKRENSQSAAAAAVRPAATAVPQREERYEFYSSLGSTACLPALLLLGRPCRLLMVVARRAMTMMTRPPDTSIHVLCRRNSASSKVDLACPGCLAPRSGWDSLFVRRSLFSTTLFLASARLPGSRDMAQWTRVAQNVGEEEE